jgi:hypothetical protein
MAFHPKMDMKHLAGDSAKQKHALKPYRASCYKVLIRRATSLPDISKNVSFTKKHNLA